MHVVSVVGARPQFVKLAPVAEAMVGHGRHTIINTGQHYDANMSDVFFDTLRIPPADRNLGIGSGSHATQTGAMLTALEEAFLDLQPDWVLVYGDTNSTLAGALAAVKIHMRVAHLEAGLRSFNRRMPEEINRVVTDHAADLLLPPTDIALGHLAREGLADRAVVVGDVMTDVLRRTHAHVSEHPSGTRPDGDYLVATIHRADNTDDPTLLTRVIGALHQLPTTVLLMAHPRLRSRAAEFGITLQGGCVEVRDPASYPEMVELVAGSRGVVTDSGGLQKEAYLLGVPCTTVRTETEWVETLTDGWNVLDPRAEHLSELAVRVTPSAPRPDYFGDGQAATRVVAALTDH